MIFAVGFPLRTLLAKLSEEERRHLAEQAGLAAVPRVDPRRLAARLSEPAYLESQLDRLPAPARQLLAALLVSGGQAMVEQVHRVSGVSPAIHALARSGLLYLVRPDYFGMVYAIPLELLDPLWQRIISGRALPVRARRSDPRDIAPAEIWTPFWHDLLLLLSETRQDPLPLTREMRLYKRAESRLLGKMWPRGNSVRQHVGLALVLAFAQENGLVVGDPYQRLLLITSHAEPFLNRPPAELWAAWWDFACRLSLGFDPVSQVCLAVAATLEPQEWVDWAAFARWMEQNCLSFFQADHLRLMLEQWAALDLVDLRADAFRLSDLGYAVSRRQVAECVPGRHIVQPTGEVLVPPEAPLGERWALRELAEVRQSDRMEVYALTAASVERALDLGIDDEQALARLARFSRTALPQNVEQNLRDWYRGLLRHRLLQVTVVHSESPHASQQVEQVLEELVLFRLSERDLVIAPDQAPAVAARLSRAGIPLRARVERPGSPREPLAPAPPRRRDSPPVGHVSLPPDDPRLEVAHQAALRDRLTEAVRRRQTLLVQYIPAGGARPVTHAIRPTMVANGWLHGTRADDNAVVAVPLPQILAAADARRETARS